MAVFRIGLPDADLFGAAGQAYLPWSAPFFIFSVFQSIPCSSLAETGESTGANG